MSNDEHAWLSIDEQTDVLVSLSGCLHSLTEAHREPAFWKHVIVNLHNALQGAMVCQLSGTAQLGALDKKSLEKTLEWLRLGRIEPRDNCVPHARLADARTLFARIHKKSERKEDAGRVLSISKEQISSFERLHSFRNDFAHFTPKGWSIELGGLPNICLDTLAVIQMIADDGWAFRHLEDGRRADLDQELSALEALLKQFANKLGNNIR
jgi:hypothetical protein